MFNATLAKRIEVTPELLILTVVPDAGVPDFLPGQYVALGMPADPQQPTAKLIKRAYSIGSSPQQRESLEFYIAVVPGGALTPALAVLREGDRLYVAPKIVGGFTLEGVPPDENLVLVATGTGLAPFVAMVRTDSTWTPARKIVIIHGVRYPADLAYRRELEELASMRSNFSYFPVVSRGGDAWQGLKGHAQKLFTPDGIGGTRIELDPARDHVYLCGNPAMIDESEALLLGMGYEVCTKRNPGRLHFERYW